MTTTDEREAGAGTEPATGGIPHRRLILGAAAAVVVAALVTWAVAFSPLLGVRTVAVRGTHTLTADQVRSVAHIVNGTPLVRLDTDAARVRIEQLPDVASATVTTSYPSTVEITVTERAALGMVASGSAFMLVDRTGDQFRRVSERPSALPLFVVPDGTDARTTGGAVATVARALPAFLRARVASIQALDPNAITLVLHNGRIVRWGSASRNADKARVLPALLRQRGSQFDLTDPDQPFSR